MTNASVFVGVAVVALACAAARQAARRKGRTLAWGMAALCCPPVLLLLELLPPVADPAPAVRSNLVLEWAGSLTVLMVLLAALVMGVG